MNEYLVVFEIKVSFGGGNSHEFTREKSITCDPDEFNYDLSDMKRRLRSKWEDKIRHRIKNPSDEIDSPISAKVTEGLLEDFSVTVGVRQIMEVRTDIDD